MSRRVVLFDLDGVLTSRDTFATLVRRQVLRSPVRTALALPALPAMAATGGHPGVRGHVSRFLVRVALAGVPLQEAREMSRRVGVEFSRSPQWLRRPGVDAARQHVARGDRVVVVTATERGLARALLDGLGLTDVELVASELAGAWAGVRLRPHNYGRHKRDTLAASGVPRPWSVMYSDSWADHALLDEVATVILVEPSPRLLAKAKRRWGERVQILSSPV